MQAVDRKQGINKAWPMLVYSIPLSVTYTIIQDQHVHMYVGIPDSVFVSLLFSLLESSLL